MSSIEDLIYGVVLLFMDVSSSSGQYSGINLRSWLWTSHLDEMEMDYFPLLYHSYFHFKKFLSFIFIFFSKNAKIIGESLHDYL